MPRLRRSTSASRDTVRDEEEGRKLERSRSANLSSKPCRWRLRRHWRAFVVGCGCLTVVLLAVPRDVPECLLEKNPVPSKKPHRVCPDEWYEVPEGITIDFHVVARGNSDNLRTTLMTLADACYPEDVTLALHVWALTEHAQEVLPAQDGFVWTKGTFHPHVLTTEHGEVPPLEGWARMWTFPGKDEVRLVLPEGLQLSWFFYFWLTGTLHNYLGAGASAEELRIFRENVFGISLSATGLTEVSGKPLSWDAYEAADGKNPIFHTLPGSRGTAFFGWQWNGFLEFMDTRAKVLDADSWEGEPLLHASAVQSWAGSLERFLGEYSHGRGLGILHPNLNGGVSFARQAPSGAISYWYKHHNHNNSDKDKEKSRGGGVVMSEGSSTPQPTPRGTDEMERPPETIVESLKEASSAVEKQMPVSAVPAYDLMFQRHTDLSHLRLLAYRFMQRLQEAQSRNLELESLWQRPGVEEPVYSHLKYLIYQPQFGMGNQLRALEAGLAVARVLGRMLVVPDYIADNGEGMPVRYDAIWEFGFLEEVVGRDKVILQTNFDALLREEGVIDPPQQLYIAEMPIKQLEGKDEYFERMGWGQLPKIPLPLANTTEAGWRELQQMEDQVLAVSAMFGMFQGWSENSLQGDEHWHNMVKLHVSEEASWLKVFVEDSLDRFTRKATMAAADRDKGSQEVQEDGETLDLSVSALETQFMCAHVRRQDFQQSCASYEEEYHSESAREWVAVIFDNGGICWVEEDYFRETLQFILKQAPVQIGVNPQFVFATSDDGDFLEATKYGNAVPVFTLDDVPLPKDLIGDGESDTSASAGRQLITPQEVRAALPAIDVAVCSRAALLLLNQFSTYSALIKAKAKAQPNFVRGLYWTKPSLPRNWRAAFLVWFHGLFGKT